MPVDPEREFAQPAAMVPEYIDPTPGSRRRLIVIFAVALFVGLPLLEGVKLFGEQIEAKELCDQIAKFNLLWAFACGAWAAVGAYLAWLGVRVLTFNQWPLPGTKVFRRTRIHRGRSAKLRALGVLAAAVIFVAGPLWSWYTVDVYMTRITS